MTYSQQTGDTTTQRETEKRIEESKKAIQKLKINAQSKSLKGKGERETHYNVYIYILVKKLKQKRKGGSDGAKACHSSCDHPGHTRRSAPKC